MDSKERKVKDKFDYLSKEVEPNPNVIKNCIYAFIIGGLFSVVGEFVGHLCLMYGATEEHTKNITPIVMVLLGAILTGVGIYDKIANKAGAGTLVPITGFANAIVSPAMEFKKEGQILGIASKMFVIAGPVLVYGTITSIIIGFVYYFIH